MSNALIGIENSEKIVKLIKDLPADKLKWLTILTGVSLSYKLLDRCLDILEDSNHINS